MSDLLVLWALTSNPSPNGDRVGPESPTLINPAAQIAALRSRVSERITT